MEEVIIFSIIVGLVAIWMLDRVQKKHRKPAQKSEKISWEKPE